MSTMKDSSHLVATETLGKSKRNKCAFCKDRLSLAFIAAFECKSCKLTWCNGCKLKHDCAKEKDLQDRFRLVDELYKHKMEANKIEKI